MNLENILLREVSESQRSHTAGFRVYETLRIVALETDSRSVVVKAGLGLGGWADD